MVSLTGCDKEVSRSPVETPAPQGFIYVESSPSGFTIFQNGKNTGRLTPDSLRYLESGTYQITLKKNYFRDTSVTINVTEGILSSINIDYYSSPAMYGNLSFITLPAGASIILNDSSLNLFTPQLINGLLPGVYNIKYTLFNYRDGETDVAVRSSQTAVADFELRDTSEWVDYQVFNSGIQSNSLTTITVDNNGVKWIGTINSGLISYDENNFINYNAANSSLPNNKINSLILDNQNRVWAGTDGGIGIFDGNSWIVYNSGNSGLTSNLINIIRFDNSGNAWIGTSANLIKFDGINWTVYNEPLGRDWIEDLFIESDNKIWLGTKANGIFILENGVYTEFLKTDYNYPTYSISSISPDQSGNLWFCFLPDTSGRGGVSYWDGFSFTTFFLGTFSNNINHIFIDLNNNKWMSASEGLVNYDALNVSRSYTTLNSLISSNSTNASVVDAFGNVWITTAGGGLNKFKWSPP